MDFLLADEATMEKMREEYAACIKSACALSCEVGQGENHTASKQVDDVADGEKSAERKSVCLAREACARDIRVLFLYIALILSYNARYGTQIYDPDRGVGRIRRESCAFGSLNHLSSNNG